MPVVAYLSMYTNYTTNALQQDLPFISPYVLAAVEKYAPGVVARDERVVVAKQRRAAYK